MFFKNVFLITICIVFSTFVSFAVQDTTKTEINQNDSLSSKARSLMKQAKIESAEKEIKVTIRNVDISQYPVIKVIVEAYNIYGEPLDTLTPEKLTVLENGIEKKVISIEKISIQERIPVDFIFVIDQTGSMQSYIDAVRGKISGFANFLKGRGIDYRLGLIIFSDEVDKIYQPTEDLTEFLRWLSSVKARGGGDAKENALEALSAASTNVDYRPSANKVAVLITDAPFHQAGEKGVGKTDFTTETIAKHLNNNDVRVFSIVPPKLTDYGYISSQTRGTTYDMDYSFSVILDNFSSQLTNLFALRYKTDKPAIPDSIDIALINEKKQLLTRKTIPIVELGRKLIIENMLYETGNASLPNKVKELEVLTEFMKNKKNVVIMIEGHTDNIGSHAINDALSLQRAESVKNYLIKNGISTQRIKTKGYGERRPIASNNTDFGRKLNRRTEIIIIAK